MKGCCRILSKCPPCDCQEQGLSAALEKPKTIRNKAPREIPVWQDECITCKKGKKENGDKK